MQILTKTQTKKYFVTRYSDTGNKRRRVKYVTEYRIFGVKVFSKVTAVKKAHDQKMLPLENGARQMALAYQASIQ